MNFGSGKASKDGAAFAAALVPGSKAAKVEGIIQFKRFLRDNFIASFTHVKVIFNDDDIWTSKLGIQIYQNYNSDISLVRKNNI